MGRRNRRGFTVMEKLTVLAIMGVLLSIAASAFVNYQKKARLRNAIETIGAHIRQVRWNARMQSRRIEIIFDAEKGSYRINGTRTANLPPGIRFGTDSSVTSKPGQPYSPPPADGISFACGRLKNVARFYATGTVSPTGSVFVTNGKETMALTVALTGRPKLWRSEGGRKWVSF